MQPHGLHGILQARILEKVAIPFSTGSSQLRDQIQVSHISGTFLKAEPQRKPKNTGVDSLSLLNRTRVFCITGRFFTSWATKEAHSSKYLLTLSLWFVPARTESLPSVSIPGPCLCWQFCKISLLLINSPHFLFPCLPFFIVCLLSL